MSRFITILTLFAVQSFFAQGHKPYLADSSKSLGLNGKVRSVREQHLEILYRNDSTSLKPYDSFTQTFFSKNGQLDRKESTHEGKLDFTEHYFYEKSGRLYEIRTKIGVDKEYVSEQYDWDKSGNLIQDKYFDKLQDKVVLEYESNMVYDGDLIMYSETIARTPPDETLYYFYDENKKPVGYIYLTRKNRTKRDFCVKSTFDPNGNKTRDEFYIMPEAKLEFEFDNKNHKRNSLSKMIELTDKRANSTEYEFDKHNNIVRSVTFDSDAKITSEENYEYIYDKHGNWVQMKTLKGKRTTSVIERKIMYY